MESDVAIDGTKFDGPLRFMTHERCSDPCPEFRDRIDGSDAFEFCGMWGPIIETTDRETIAEGHESLRLVLNAVLEDDSPARSTCTVYDCDAAATHTAEFDSERAWFTARYCVDCADTERPNIVAVYEGRDTKFCDHDRCFNAVHASRECCPCHQ
ncbi:hypothetical protein [Halovivax cerinus]|uniref:Uncharacterized protein n=1 Tax=Halovivax cerinus TaxID=1487865 RepID=A0ABD5NN28_9EURY|nr:hypothetical protein [Halovivax cerinus]